MYNTHFSSVISFSGMSKDISELFFEITKEGRKTYGNIFSRMLNKEAFKRGIVYCLVRKCTRTKIPVVSERAEKMIWPSEYRSMADAWELSGEEGRDKLR